jgi:hypothetical protein
MKLDRLIEVKKCQKWHAVGEHNFPIVHPAGQPPTKSYRILDAFKTIQPTIGQMGKYGFDLIEGPFANVAKIRNAKKAEEKRRRGWEVIRRGCEWRRTWPF